MSSLRGRPYSIGIAYVELVAELVPYTVRFEIDNNGNEVAPCQEYYNFNEALRNFVPESGFDHVDDWVNTLKNNQKKQYLYHVFLVHCFTGFAESPQLDVTNEMRAPTTRETVQRRRVSHDTT
jgi:hypothetical protein